MSRKAPLIVILATVGLLASEFAYLGLKPRCWWPVGAKCHVRVSAEQAPRKRYYHVPARFRDRPGVLVIVDGVVVDLWPGSGGGI